ncbi:MAG TPA: MauE/DoxX family redox-associated membrane protein [Chitinophagales bacterium]|nr:MauE/DoxX family redox-associated membrane protein [Chitinophagales bacterium]
MIQKTLPRLSIFLIGIFFLVSAVAKLFPVISFEFSLGSYGLPWALTPYVARVVIGIELILGGLLVLQYRLRKVSIPLAVSFLLLMTLVLVYRWITAGADADCGCMGAWLEMTPIQSILKNVILLIILLLAQRFIVSSIPSSFHNYLMGIFAIIALTAPFIVEPVYVGANSSRDTQEVRRLDVDLFYTKNQEDSPKTDLKNGKHIIAFLSISCPHCQKAANKLGIIQRQHPEYPIHLFINGNDETVNEFRKQYKCEEVPFSKLLQPQFLQLSGPELPSIQYIQDGMIQREVNYLDIDNAGIEEFLN